MISRVLEGEAEGGRPVPPGVPPSKRSPLARHLLGPSRLQAHSFGDTPLGLHLMLWNPPHYLSGHVRVHGPGGVGLNVLPRKEPLAARWGRTGPRASQPAGRLSWPSSIAASEVVPLPDSLKGSGTCITAVTFVCHFKASLAEPTATAWRPGQGMPSVRGAHCVSSQRPPVPRLRAFSGRHRSPLDTGRHWSPPGTPGA